jgi:hypothetical protein
MFRLYLHPGGPEGYSFSFTILPISPARGLPGATRRNEQDIKRIYRAELHWHILAQNLLSSRLLSKYVKVRICKTISLPVVLYGCEIWSLALREEHRLAIFKNRVLRRIFGPKRVKEKNKVQTTT